ncbi:MAG: DUF5916 domain-containing protein [Vicinamibacterales bacterium]
MYTPRTRPPGLLAMVALLATAGPALAQSGPSAPADIDGPAAPVPPAMVSRDASGRVTMRATRLAEPLVLDGRLDEAVYGRVPAVSDFVEQEPFEGRPATEKTEVWVWYDDEAVYVSARNWESDPSRRVMSDMQRDARNLFNNDHLAVMFDTFYDRRNGYYFYANAQGGMVDGQLTNEAPNNNWNGLWEVRTGEFDGGWTVEFRFPFRSIRFGEDGRPWGINFRRVVRWKNEISYLTPIPQAWGRRGLTKVSSGATIVGIVPPRGLRNIDVKPYLLGSSVTDREADPPIRDDGTAEFGLDAKWAITQSFVTDFTYNTDFAQVEDDEAQVNLTRFSVFFPEKREFFLEGQDYFNFGGAGGGGGGPGGGQSSTPVVFYSRRIGISDDGLVPIVGGGRLLGRAGGFQVGALQMRTGASASAGAAAADYSVVRVNRDIGARSRIGVIGTRRGAADLAGANYAWGADASLNFTTEWSATAYWARTRSPGLDGPSASYRGRLEYNSDRYGLQAEHLYVGDDFDPEVGFLRRSAFRRSFGQARFSPRPASLPGVRKLTWEGSVDYYEDTAGRLESRDVQGMFRVEFTNTDQLTIQASDGFERLDEPFEPADGVVIAAGGYDARTMEVRYQLSPARPVSGNVSVRRGGFFGGTITEISWRGRVEFSSRVYAEPTLSINRIDTPEGRGRANLIGSRLTYTLTPRMFVGALVQFRSASERVSTNVRFRWEYQPGSELFVVYSDGRSTADGGFPPRLRTRTFVVKLTRLFRW